MYIFIKKCAPIKYKKCIYLYVYIFDYMYMFKCLYNILIYASIHCLHLYTCKQINVYVRENILYLYITKKLTIYLYMYIFS